VEPIIEIKNLTHIYSPNTPFEQRALDNVDLTIYRGEYLGIIGRTGSGKSTLIQHLNGLLKPTSGQILFEGKDIWSSKAMTHDIRYQVGLVFQYPEYQLFEETVYKDIAYGPRNMKLPEEEVDRRVRQAAQFAGLSDAVLERSPFELSGGQKRRVAIAGVIAMEPKVLILDEPTAGLDPVGVDSILKNIRDYHEAHNATIIMVSHSMEDMARLADRLLVFASGKLVADGTPRAVFSDPDLLTGIGLDIPESAKLCAALREAGYDLPPDLYRPEELREHLLRLWKEAGAC